MSTLEPDLSALRCLIYRRISKDLIGDELGVQRQQKELIEYAEKQRWVIAGDFVDNDASASKGRRRDAYQGLLSSVRAGHGDVILCTEMSRLTRHPRELEDLVDLVDEHHVRITALRAGDLNLNTSYGRMVARMLGAAARQEIETMAERLRSQQAQRRSKGMPHGGQRAVRLPPNR